jgi:diketogulonate reductase-like aldo/keto reductase
MPALGLGTYKMSADRAGQAVEYALAEAGYDHVDCAAIYANEKEIGEAFRKIFVNDGARKREDVFITSKLWNTEHHKEDVRPACERTLRDLGLEYLDLYLIHWGVAIPKIESDPLSRLNEQKDESNVLVTEDVPIRETWEAMEELLQAGLVKAVGVSNFTQGMLEDVLSYAKIRPAMNQVELHPYLQQQELVQFCKSEGIAMTAYMPLGSPARSRTKGLPVIMEDEVILEIAGAHNKTPAQVMLRWGIQRGTVVIPKSENPERIKENADVFDFKLTSEEMEKMAALDKNVRLIDPARMWNIQYFD